jgi:spore germination protein GerM
MSRRALTILVLTVVAVAIGALLVWRTPRLTSRATPRAAAAPSPTAPAPPGRKIKARLFYVADDGMRLTSVERDIAYGEGTVEQAREIVAAQIAPVLDPLVSAVPPGTALRAVFLTQSGEAYVDFSRDIVTAHPGGTQNELLTVYTIVNALTVNLPAVTAVQLLVDGKEVETLSGHIDLRQPLAKNLSWVKTEDVATKE